MNASKFPEMWDLLSEESEQGDWDLEEVIGSLYDDVLISNAHGTILKVSGHFKRLYGKPSDQLIGKTVHELEQEGVFTPSITKLVLQEKTKQIGIQKTEGGRRVLVTGVPVFDRKGRFVRVICFSRDITEPMRLKEHFTLMEQEMERLRSELDNLRQEAMDSSELVAVHPSMKHTLQTARRVAQVDVHVLLQGESGVGKTAMARYIHQHSPRSKGPFIEVNCGAIPEALFESELFGYEEGAFTGAKREGKMGFAELADQGTLFLDEVGELPKPLQVKVLKLIQEKQFYRIGGSRPVKSDFRLITATNRDLEERVKAREFREDLYFRLHVVPITVPPLRQRPEDLLALIDVLLDRYCRKHGLRKTLDARVKKQLMEYPWPGNVRELENLLERLVVVSPSDTIHLEDLPGQFQQAAPLTSLENVKGKTLPEIVAQVERDLLLQARQAGKSTTEIAKMFGISQSTVVRKLQRYKREGMQ
jgi:PAS domain S-box-containing protein